MNETSEGAAVGKAPVHLWVVGVLSLVWSLMGVFDYLATQLEFEAYMSQFTPEQLEYFNSFPKIMVAFWAFGVWGGFAGAIGLLLRKKWAMWAFGLSLVGLLGSTIYNFGLSNGAEIMGTGGVIFTIVIWIFAILLFLYARSMATKEILR